MITNHKSFAFLSIVILGEEAGVSREKRGLTIKKKQHHAKAFYASILSISPSLLTCLFSYLSHCAASGQEEQGRRREASFLADKPHKGNCETHTHSHVYAIARSRSPSRSSWRSKAIRIRPVDRTDSWLCDFSVYGLWTKLAGKACASVFHCAVCVCVYVSMLDHRLKLESLSALV